MSEPRFARPRTSTNRQSRQAVSKFAEDFGDTPLHAITRSQAYTWAEKNRSRHAAVRAMFNDAINDDVVDRSPFANMKLQQSRGRRDIKALTPDTIIELGEVAKRVHGAYGEQFAAMIVFAAYTGMRRGELSVLHWSDIDFNNDEILVTKTLSNDTEILPPKNGKARRIVLPPAGARGAAVRAPTDRRPRRPHLLDRPRAPVLQEHVPLRMEPGARRRRRPDLDWHELRHFAATYLVQELRLPPREAAQQLGHSDAGRLLVLSVARDERWSSSPKMFVTGSSVFAIARDLNRV